MAYVIERVVHDGVAWVGSRDGIPDPPEPPDDFEIGVTEPTASNTGFRVPEISLVNYSGDITNVSEGDVIDRLAITGQIRKSNPLVNATVRDCLVLGQTQAANAPGTASYNLIDGTATMNAGQTAGILSVEHTELRPSILNYKNNGIKGGDVTLYRVKGSNITDWFSPHGSAGKSIAKVFKAYGCFADNFRTSTPDPNQTDNITHNDHSQGQAWISVLEIIGCANGPNGRPRTSWLLLQNNSGGVYVTARINKNWMRGHATEGSTVNIPIGSATFQAFEFMDNRVSNTGNIPFGNSQVNINSTVKSTFAATIRDNIYLETGLPIPIGTA